MSTPADSDAAEGGPRLDFIRARVSADQAAGKHEGRVHTRFPPEPNGYLHIGHAKSICLNFGIAKEFGGTCNLRFDDTNPSKEEQEFEDAIKRDVAWLGFEWGEKVFYASDTFEHLYDSAVELIKKGKAYVDSLSAEEIREYRGTLTSPGQESPHRERSVEENLDLFARMRAGEFPDGTHVLRAKIDMASPNMNLRDPTLYRIRHESHHRTGDAWCIYPMYDWAHGLCDSLEGITHSLCTLEFENHRPLYDWFLETLEAYHPQQIEFARLNLTYMVMSKRYLRRLVEEGHVAGWDDPRMPTIAGMRRRGYPPEALVAFCKTIGVAKFNSTIDMALLQHTLREHLNRTCPRYMGVLDPLKVVVTNFPAGEVLTLNAVNNPEDESAGRREVPFTRELYIDRDDFMEDPPKKFFRLAPGREVRLRYACLLTCDEVIKDEAGQIVELRCTWDPESQGGKAPDGRKVKGTIHWVSAEHCRDAEVRLYDHLFKVENPGKSGDFEQDLNPESLVTIRAKVEPAVAELEEGTRFQFERKGYFSVDLDRTPERLVFNRTVTLRDTWAKVQQKAGGGQKKKPGEGKKRKRKRNRGEAQPAEGQPAPPAPSAE